jgi:hypothetical protein
MTTFEKHYIRKGTHVATLSQRLKCFFSYFVKL